MIQTPSDKTSPPHTSDSFNFSFNNNYLESEDGNTFTKIPNHYRYLKTNDPEASRTLMRSFY